LSSARCKADVDDQFAGWGQLSFPSSVQSSLWCAELLILLMGTDIAAGFDLNEAFWKKMDKLMQRKSRMVNGRIRVSDFRGVEHTEENSA